MPYKGMFTRIEKSHSPSKTAMIPLRPRGSGAQLGTPLQRQVQIWITPEPGLPRFVQHGSFRETAIDLRRVRFLIDPRSQALPKSYQTLVGDIKHRIGRQLDLSRGHKKRPPRTPEMFDDSQHSCFG